MLCRSFFGHKDIESDSADIRQKPSDGDCPPDAGKSDGRNWGKQVSKENPCSQRNDGKDDRDPRLTQSPEQSVQKKQAAYPAVACAFDAEILHPDGDDLSF